jgi:hypothetical protein
MIEPRGKSYAALTIPWNLRMIAMFWHLSEQIEY